MSPKVSGTILFVLFVLASCTKDDMVCLPVCKISPTSVMKIRGNIGFWDSSTINTADGHVVVCGARHVGDSTRMLAVKATEAGDILWEHAFNTGGTSALGVCETQAGDLLFVGRKCLGEKENERCHLILSKLSSLGGVHWNRYYEDLEMTGHSILELHNGDIILSGYHDGQHVIVNTDPDGAINLVKRDTLPSYGVLTSSIELANGTLLFTGYQDVVYLRCYDANAELLWEKTYGPRVRFAGSTIQTANGDLITVGSANEGALIIKTTEEGELIWERVNGTTEYYEHCRAIRENEDGSFVITGYASKLGVEIDPFLMHVDESGREISTVFFQGNELRRGENIVKTMSGDNVITGSANGDIFFLPANNYGM